MSKIPIGKQPETTFMDEEDNIKVKLISFPDPDGIKRMFIDTCYGHDMPNASDVLNDKEKDAAIETLISGGTLPKGLEMCGKFVFLVENISLTITHAFVRHRFFTILQSSTAVRDLRDESFVMPRSFATDDNFYQKVIDWYLTGKKLYCQAVDSQGISVQNARLLIPKNNCNHMFIGCDLKALIDAYGQRMDTNEEPIQHNIVFGKMRDLVLEKFPYLKSCFVDACATGRCFHSKAGSQNNIVFKRNEVHKKFLPPTYDLSKEVTLHDFTRDQMNAGPVIEKEKYIGRTHV